MSTVKLSIQPCEHRRVKAKHIGQYFYDKYDQRIFVVSNNQTGFLLVDITNGQRHGYPGGMDEMNKCLNEEIDRFIEIDPENIQISVKV